MKKWIAPIAKMCTHKWWLCWKISAQCVREINFIHSDITVNILHCQILTSYNWRHYLSITPRRWLVCRALSHRYGIFSWWWAHSCQKNVQKCNKYINPLNAKLNPTCHLLALLEAHHIFHVSRIRVKKNYALSSFYSQDCTRRRMYSK
jgi:hypothetical protein